MARPGPPADRSVRCFPAIPETCPSGEDMFFFLFSALLLSSACLGSGRCAGTGVSRTPRAGSAGAREAEAERAPEAPALTKRV
ncbi:hypothetical protein SAMN05421630_106112 [Prauserella marina]|uniref:Uncharacterized protein n=1 Tax=Prauserella marina TaxID=530584 RepID=A0A1G6SC20_9PSEU|nr:hypothetical protein DES30_102112 [Prauserella marina]SDD14450.1 hypothetical protein SAMN05421630_106112 [Prauserella marina]